MGTWMPDITKKPTLAQKIEFGHDCSDVHLWWADYVVNHPEYIATLGDTDWHLECAVLHEESAIEFEEVAQQQGGQKSGCLSFRGLFGRRK